MALCLTEVAIGFSFLSLHKTLARVFFFFTLLLLLILFIFPPERRIFLVLVLAAILYLHSEFWIVCVAGTQSGSFAATYAGPDLGPAELQDVDTYVL